MNNEMACPKCDSDKKVKRGFALGRQRYLCKNCGCNYTKSTRHGYSNEFKKEAIRYYLEGIGFRKIERLLKVSHVSVINWVKNEAKRLRKILPTEEKVDVLELDEMSISFKKTSGFGRQ